MRDGVEYDPRKPVPAIGGDLFAEPSGARDHRSAEALSLTYSTAPLEGDTEVTGGPRVELFASSSVFKAGHRIRLTVASSSFPKWYPNGNTGREIDEDFAPVVATNRIFHDREHPSRIALPVVPRDSSTQ